MKKQVIIDENHDLSSSPDWVNPLSNATTLEKLENEILAEDFKPNQLEERDEPCPKRSIDSIVRADFTIDFFRPLQQIEAEARLSALDSIMNLLYQDLKTEKRELVKTHLGTITRYAFEVPFDDLTSAFQQLLSRIEESGIGTPKLRKSPSLFISKSFFLPVNTKDPHLRQYFVDLFLQTGRVSHLNRVLLTHHSYFEKYYSCLSFIMRDTGPLPFDWRHYIAILSASRHDCKWLISLHQLEFTLNGGDPLWLRGIEHIPKKLGALLELIQILSHQPWLITKDHIAPLMVKGEDSWSVGELVHAMLIICTIKSIVGLIFGCGVSPEIDFLENDEPTSEDEEANKEVPSHVKADTNMIMELLKKWGITESDESDQDQFVKAESEFSDCPQPEFEHHKQDMTRYIGSYKMKHSDFDVKSKNYFIFRVQDYCWKEHGFELIRRFLPDAAILLDEQFDYIYSMTYNKFNQSDNINTFPLRRAIWQYVQRVKGMFHDDYNYKEVNLFLNKATKKFIKKVSCQPDTITKIDFCDLGYELKPDEKIHVAILAAESAKQSELLYGLRVVWQHMYR